MDIPVLHRKWAREYLTKAQHARSYARKCRYLQLAIANTVNARMLEADVEDPSDEMKTGPADHGHAPKN